MCPASNSARFVSTISHIQCNIATGDETGNKTAYFLEKWTVASIERKWIGFSVVQIKHWNCIARWPKYHNESELAFNANRP
jgi:hypothetical protein